MALLAEWDRRPSIPHGMVKLDCLWVQADAGDDACPSSFPANLAGRSAEQVAIGGVLFGRQPLFEGIEGKAEYSELTGKKSSKASRRRVLLQEITNWSWLLGRRLRRRKH